jgi:superfamily II DNA or RNA helicase
MKRELWPHQQEALTALKQTIGQGVKRVVLSAPTGAGKTLISAAIVEGAQRKNNRLAFVVSNLSLIDQTLESFYDEGIKDVGIIQADHVMTDWSKPVQICSIQTLKSRGSYPKAQVVIFDEVHVLHEFHKQWLQDPAWQSVPFIGLSATPGTKGLGKYFQTLLTVSTTEDLIRDGKLSPFKVFATGHPDLSGVKLVAGDYHEGQLSAAMQKGSLTADIVDTWKKQWGKDKTLCYGVDCAHAEMIRDRFVEAGITCGYQDARTKADERREIKRKFHNGEYQIVANVGTLTTGTDWDVRCLILARPTKSEMLYQQIIGRSLRTAEGKRHAIILDHTDTTQKLGFVTDIHWDELDDGKPKPKAAEIIQKRKLPRECPKCTAIVAHGLKVCTHCGADMRPACGVIEHDGELIEVNGSSHRWKPGQKRQYTMSDKEIWYAGFLYIAIERGYKSGWAAQQFKTKFGVWPNSFRLTEPREPSSEIRGYVQSRLIAYAMAKKKHGTIDRRVIDAL